MQWTAKYLGEGGFQDIPERIEICGKLPPSMPLEAIIFEDDDGSRFVMDYLSEDEAKRFAAEVMEAATRCGDS